MLYIVGLSWTINLGIIIRRRSILSFVGDAYMRCPYHISFNNQDSMGMVRHYRKLIYFNILKYVPGSQSRNFSLFPQTYSNALFRYSDLSKPLLSILGANRDKIIPAF